MFITEALKNTKHKGMDISYRRHTIRQVIANSPFKIAGEIKMQFLEFI
jgi:hypothetical protein